MIPTETNIILQSHEIITYVIVSAIILIISIAISTYVSVKIKKKLTDKDPQYLSRDDFIREMETYCAKCPKNTILEKLQMMLNSFIEKEKEIRKKQDEIREPGTKQYATYDTVEKNIVRIEQSLKDSADKIDKRISGIFKRIDGITNVLMMKGLLKMEKDDIDVDV